MNKGVYMRWISKRFNLRKLLFLPFIIIIVVLQVKIIFINLGEVIEKENIEKIEKHFELFKNQI